ncbi:MAG TPA: PTS sugar transporter subunit IIA [Gemmata sp.]|jgi:PTS system nitrogen regulatory IIA component|nr:PTS sugar transporter subunit IIA [Gemmata sp.]
MQLSIRDLTKLLNATENTVLRWIKHLSLPVHHVAGQYRVNRAELLEWATANNVQVSLELFDSLEADAESIPSLADALEIGGIYYALKGSNKELVLREMVQLLPLPDAVDRQLLLRLFLAREASASTGIGKGIAIPHVRNPIVLNVSQPTVTLAFLTHPIDFGALDHEPVHVLFSIISPTNRSHLQLLSRLAFSLHDEKFRETITNHGPREEIMLGIRRVEAGMSASTDKTGKAAH